MSDWWKAHVKRVNKKHPDVVAAVRLLAHVATEMEPKELIVFAAPLKAIGEEAVARVQASLDENEKERKRKQQELREAIMKLPPDATVSDEEAAFALDVSLRTVRKYAKEGKLERPKEPA